MITHIFMPGFEINQWQLIPAHQAYLREWHEEALHNADDGNICASTCLQGAFIELIQSGHMTHDWIGVLNEYLVGGDSIPIAYSKTYGKRLCGFDSQVIQSTIVAIHTHWWIEVVKKGAEAVDHERYAAMLLPKKLMNGLIYDHDVSETMLRHRMKTELTMSLAFALEIIGSANQLSNELKAQINASLVDYKICPPTRYMSTEYFRLQALRMMGAANHFPIKIERAIDACAENLTIGYCDFVMGDKRDAYMGTAKRTARDTPIHSPLTACHVNVLSEIVEDTIAKDRIKKRLDAYSKHIRAHPMDMPAFQMRDVPIPFGADRTPIEVLCAAHLIQRNTIT